MDTTSRQQVFRDRFQEAFAEIRERDLKPITENGKQVGWSGPLRKERRKEAIAWDRGNKV